MTDSFKNPSPEYRGTELFMLNDKLEGPELERQIGEMKKQGFYSFIARTYVGLKSDYPGRDFHDRTADIIGAAKKYGMKVFLQAGFMPGGVPDLPDKYTHLGLRADHTIVKQPNFLDMLNREAVDYYVQKSYEEMWAEFRGEFGKTVVSVWVDEPHFRPPDLPWTAELPAQFRKMWGYDIGDKISLLFEKKEGSDRARYHYWRTVLHLLQEAYFRGISGWCRKNNLMFSGHLMGEDTLYHQIALTCDCMPLYKYFDIPGIDFLTCDFDWRHGLMEGFRDNYLFVNTPLQCVSAAHQAGKKQILCEMFGVSKQNLTFEDQKYIFDFFAGFGVNHKMVHGVFYSLKGRAKRAYPPHINYYQPYWNDYGFVNDYMARTSWFISQGKPAADVLVIHPVESAFCDYDYEYTRTKTLTKADRSFNELLQRLLAAHIPFELGDEETIAECGKTEKGQFIVGEMAYKTVILPGLKVIRESTLELLEKFSLKGGRVIFLGGFSCIFDTKNQSEYLKMLEMKNSVYIDSDTELVQWLTENLDLPFSAECRGDCSQVSFNLRQTETGYHIFVFNMDRGSSHEIKLLIKGKFGARRYIGETGKQIPWPAETANAVTSVSFTVVRGGSFMLGLDRNEKQVQPKKDEIRKVINVSGGFRVTPRQPNVLLLENACYCKEDGILSDQFPILAIHNQLKNEKYEGEITLEYLIQTDCRLTGLSLALEDSALTEIELNGAAVNSVTKGYYFSKSFEIVSLPGSLKKGVNHLKLKRRFKSPEKPKTNYSALYENLGGVELESIYLLGDFLVKSIPEKTGTGCTRLSPLFTLTKNPHGDTGINAENLAAGGFPFFAGTIELQKTVYLPKKPGTGAELILEGFRGCTARVIINGKPEVSESAEKSAPQLIAWPPCSADVSGLLRQGENSIVIEITNTLRNLLGPYHRPAGEPGHCWQSYSSPDTPWMGEYPPNSDQAKPGKWYENRRPDTPQWTDSYLQVPFGLAGFRIEYY